MTIQPIGLSMSAQSPSSANAGYSRTAAASAHAGIESGANGSRSSVALLSEDFSMSAMTLNYTNADGDSVSLGVSSVDYQKAILAANDDASPESWKKIIDQIKDEYERMRGAIVEEVFGGDDESRKVSDPREFDEAKEIPGLPEYWNAENTSQRIVDFAVSFAGMFEGGDEEFAGMIKDAIEDGFSQAKDILGDLPGVVGKLVDKTYALVMDKIDRWLEDRKAGGATAAASAAAETVASSAAAVNS